MNYNTNAQSYGSPKSRASYAAQEEAELREYLIQKRRPLRGNVIYRTYPGANNECLNNETNTNQEQSNLISSSRQSSVTLDGDCDDGQSIANENDNNESPKAFTKR
ncbi:8286_t:CDS:2 [Ambispora leptoticha]|uniref:8286_t:CDS:1 n=1 Tax=Ambispora leptoticha TaxID=144679 RepID=A0A9N9CKJ0_9GLOM|nr:8286_t:CDS:2 [Ambispora leptoticha]